MPSWASAANHYVRAGASGTGTGADWTNACTDFAGSCAVSSLVRGDTYYVATGTYAGRIFNTAVSGTSVITIKGATAADHGTDTGWSAAYGVDVTQAHFTFGLGTYGLAIMTSYFVFDGNTGSGTTASSYGFTIDQPANCTTAQDPYLFVGILSTTVVTRNVTVSHVAISGCSALTYNSGANNAFQLCASPGFCDTITLSHTYVEGPTVKFAQMHNVNNSVVEYNIIKSVGTAFSEMHAEFISSNNCHDSDGGLCTGSGTVFCTQGDCASNNTIRYNTFGNMVGISNTGAIVALDGNPQGLRGWSIYGNLFIGSVGSNGVIGTGTSGSVGAGPGLKIYNNTFVNIPGSYLFHQCSSATGCAGVSAGGSVITNNLIYSGYGEIELGTAYGGPAITHSYNTYFATTGSILAGTAIQTGSSNPFVSYSATCCGGDYRLADGTTVNAGTTLAAPYNYDRTGVLRGGDGVWDRGAYEYGGTTPVAPNAPTNVRIR
jgi:hypothetical protein